MNAKIHPLSFVRHAVLSGAILLSVALTGCETPGQSALLGAATGAAIGGAHRGRGHDAVRGAAIGAGAGYVAGRVVQGQRERAYDQGYRDSRYERSGYRERRVYQERRGYYDRRGYWHSY